jgi:hypothetical protein
MCGHNCASGRIDKTPASLIKFQTDALPRVHSLSAFKARVIQRALHWKYSAFEQMILEFSTDGAQPAEQSYPSVFHKLPRAWQPVIPVIARSEATKQSSLVCCAGGLDCFAALAMTILPSAAQLTQTTPGDPQGSPAPHYVPVRR